MIDDPTEIAQTMEQILRAELGLERTGTFEELDVDLEEETEDDEGIEAEIPDDDNVGEQIEAEIPEDQNEDL